MGPALRTQPRPNLQWDIGHNDDDGETEDAYNYPGEMFQDNGYDHAVARKTTMTIVAKVANIAISIVNTRIYFLPPSLSLPSLPLSLSRSPSPLHI